MVLPLDMPDDYIYLPGSGKSTLGDMGELASRLGSPVTYDRRGSVYWYDTFESGISGYFIGLSGAGASIRYTHNYVFSGLMSAKLTAGSTSLRRAQLVKRIAPSLITTYGVEFTFSLGGNVGGIHNIFQLNRGGYRIAPEVIYTTSTGLLIIGDNVNPAVNIDTFSIDTNNPTLFHTMKLVIDAVNERGVRLLFDQAEYDISNVTFAHIADVTNKRIEITIQVSSEGATNGIIYVDNIIATVGDP